MNDIEKLAQDIERMHGDIELIADSNIKSLFIAIAQRFADWVSNRRQTIGANALDAQEERMVAQTVKIFVKMETVGVPTSIQRAFIQIRGNMFSLIGEHQKH